MLHIISRINSIDINNGKIQSFQFIIIYKAASNQDKYITQLRVYINDLLPISDTYSI